MWARFAGKEFDLRAFQAERVGQERDDRLVRLAFFRRGGYADFQDGGGRPDLVLSAACMGANADHATELMGDNVYHRSIWHWLTPHALIGALIGVLIGVLIGALCKTL